MSQYDEREDVEVAKVIIEFTDGTTLTQDLLEGSLEPSSFKRGDMAYEVCGVEGGDALEEIGGVLFKFGWAQ